MNHISIEGMDGVGKSTTCKCLSGRLGYIFVEKPLHYLFDKDDNSFDEYIRIRDKINSNPNRVLSSMFYGLGSIYLYDKYKYVNIITDRHLASNYAWSHSNDNDEVYDLLVKKLPKPKLTVILYAPSDVILKRLIKRNKNDSDINKVMISEEIYKRMVQFCEKYSYPYILLDTSKLSPAEVVDKILEELDKHGA